MTKDSHKVVVVMPAYNAARTIKDTYEEIPPQYRKHVILVDDRSKDDTVEVAKKLGIATFTHPNNLGYGGNQKTCYWEALKLNPDAVVMLHPDYQYDASMMPYLVQPILDGKYDYMFGSRIATKKGALAGGMPPVKYIVNRIVCFIQNILLGVNFSEHFSGYRVYSKHLLETIPFQRFSNDFNFDQEMAISAISYDMRIGEFPIPTRYHEKQSSIRFLKGTKFILDGFWTIFKYGLHRAGVIKDNRFAPRSFKKESRLMYFLPFFLLGLTIFTLKSTEELNFGLMLFVFIQSVLLFFLFKPEKLPNLFKKQSLVFTAILLMTGFFVGITGFTKEAFIVSGYEKDLLLARREVYKRELGIIGRNNSLANSLETTKFYMDKTTRKIAQPMDFNRYFSIDKSSLYYFVILPFFIGGFLYLLTTDLFLLTGYLIFTAFISIFVQPNYSFILFFPVINFSAVMGLLNIKSLLNYFKN